MTSYERNVSSIKYGGESEGYKMGDGPKPVARDDHITVMEGAAMSYKFGKFWFPRTMNGSVVYHIMRDRDGDDNDNNRSPTSVTTVSTPLPLPPPPPTYRPTYRPTPYPTSKPTAHPAITSALMSDPTPPPRGIGYPTFSFYVMGDVPYTVKEEIILRSQLDQMTSLRTNPHGLDDDDDDRGEGDSDANGDDRNSRFVVHVGDVQNAKRTQCSADKLNTVRDILTDHSPQLPILMTPGDNDWNDCPNPRSAWDRWTDAFLDPPLERNWMSNDMTTAISRTSSSSSLTTSRMLPVPGLVRRQPVRPENFAFRYSDVLFIGINMVSSGPDGSLTEDQWESRLDDNIDWIDENVDFGGLGGGGGGGGGGNPIPRAVVVFGHSKRGRRVLHHVRSRFGFMSMPVVYFHGDGHEYEIERTYYENERGWDRYWRVQVDQGAVAPPLRVTVRGTTKEALADAIPPFFNDDGDGDAGVELLGDEGDEIIRLDRRLAGDPIRTHPPTPVPTFTPTFRPTFTPTFRPTFTPTISPTKSDPIMPSSGMMTSTATTTAYTTTTTTTAAVAAATTAPPDDGDLNSNELNDIDRTESSRAAAASVELSSVRTIMEEGTAELTVFVKACSDFLNARFRYSTPRVTDVTCEVRGQTLRWLLTDRDRRRTGGRTGGEEESTSATTSAESTATSNALTNTNTKNTAPAAADADADADDGGTMMIESGNRELERSLFPLRIDLLLRGHTNGGFVDGVVFREMALGYFDDDGSDFVGALTEASLEAGADGAEAPRFFESVNSIRSVRGNDDVRDGDDRDDRSSREDEREDADDGEGSGSGRGTDSATESGEPSSVNGAGGSGSRGRGDESLSIAVEGWMGILLIVLGVMVVTALAALLVYVAKHSR